MGYASEFASASEHSIFKHFRTHVIVFARRTVTMDVDEASTKVAMLANTFSQKEVIAALLLRQAKNPECQQPHPLRCNPLLAINKSEAADPEATNLLANAIDQKFVGSLPMRAAGGDPIQAAIIVIVELLMDVCGANAVNVGEVQDALIKLEGDVVAAAHFFLLKISAARAGQTKAGRPRGPPTAGNSTSDEESDENDATSPAVSASTSVRPAAARVVPGASAKAVNPSARTPGRYASNPLHGHFHGPPTAGDSTSDEECVSSQ